MLVSNFSSVDRHLLKVVQQTLYLIFSLSTLNFYNIDINIPEKHTYSNVLETNNFDLLET